MRFNFVCELYRILYNLPKFFIRKHVFSSHLFVSVSLFIMDSVGFCFIDSSFPKMESGEKSWESSGRLLGSFFGGPIPLIRTVKSVESVENISFIKNNFQSELY